MSGQVSFSPKIFTNHETLQSFFSGEKEIKAINSQAATAVAMQISLSRKIAMVVKSIFSFVAGLFLYICSFPLGLVHANNLYIRCKLLSIYYRYNCNDIFARRLLGKNLLVLSRNMHDLSTPDLYLAKNIHKDLRLSNLIHCQDGSIEELKNGIMNIRKQGPNLSSTDLLMIESLESSIKSMQRGYGDIKFAHLDGVCFGMSIWFAFLYLNSYQSQDSLKHLVAVAKQFENGAPRQAGLIQSLFNRLDLKLHSFIGIPTYLKLQVENTIKKELLDKGNQDFFKFLHNMENGIYYMSLQPKKGGGHAMCFIKEGEHKYIFDPNTGLLNIHDEKTFQTFYNSMIRKEYQELEIFKLMKDALPIQVLKKVSKAPKGVLFRIAHKISHLFSKKAA